MTAMEPAQTINAASTVEYPAYAWRDSSNISSRTAVAENHFIPFMTIVDLLRLGQTKKGPAWPLLSHFENYAATVWAVFCKVEYATSKVLTRGFGSITFARTFTSSG